MSHSPGSVDGLPLFGPLTRIEARLIRMGLTVEFKHSRFVFLDIGDEDIDEDEDWEEEVREHIRQREEDAKSEAEGREQEKEENSNLRMARVNSREKARESHSEEEQHAGERQLALMEENLPLPNCSYLPASDELRIFREAASPQQYGTRLAKELFLKPGIYQWTEFHHCDELMKKFFREAVNTRFPTPRRDRYRSKWSRISAAITRLFKQHNTTEIARAADMSMQRKKSLSQTPVADTARKLKTRSRLGILKNKVRFSPSPAQKPDVSNSSNTMVAQGVPGPVTHSALTWPTRTSGKRPLSSTPRAPPKKALPANTKKALPAPPKKALPAPPKKALPAPPKKALPAPPKKTLPANPPKKAPPALPPKKAPPTPPPKKAPPTPPPKKAPPARISPLAGGAKRQSRSKKGKPPPWSCARIRPFNRQSFLDFIGNSSPSTPVASAASSKDHKKKKLSTTPRSRPASSPHKSNAIRKRFRFSTPTGNKSSNTGTSAARPAKQAKKEYLGGSPWLERDPGGMPLTRSHTSSARPNYCSPFPKLAKTSTADGDMKSAKKARTRTSEPFNPNFPNRH